MPKKRKKEVEKHYDDLGDDVSGLGDDFDSNDVAKDDADVHRTAPNSALVAGLHRHVLARRRHPRRDARLYVVDSFEAVVESIPVERVYLVMDLHFVGDDEARLFSRWLDTEGSRHDILATVDVSSSAARSALVEAVLTSAPDYLVLDPSHRTTGEYFRPPDNGRYEHDQGRTVLLAHLAVAQKECSRLFVFMQQGPTWISDMSQWHDLCASPQIYSSEFQGVRSRDQRPHGVHSADDDSQRVMHCS